MKSPLLIFCVSAASLTFTLGTGVANAQYHSNFDNKGNIKPISEWGGNRSNLGNPAPRAEPKDTRTATPEDLREIRAHNRMLAREREQDKIKSYGRYDFVSDADGYDLRVVTLSTKSGPSQRVSETKQGCINSAGEVVIPIEYDKVKPGAFGFYEVHAYGKCGVVNKVGEVIVPVVYASVVHGLSSDDEEGLFEMKEIGNTRKWGTVSLNRHGRVILAQELHTRANFGYKTRGIFSEGLCRVSNERDKYGFIDQDKKVIVALMYDEVEIYSQGLANVRLGKHWGYIDKVGKVVIPIEYDEGKHFREDGLALVKLDEKYGYIDTNGKAAIPLIYDEAKVVTSYNFGCYGVKSKGKWQFVDKTGAALMDLQADDILEGFALPTLFMGMGSTPPPGSDVPTALVLKDYETFRVDKTGKVIGVVTKVLPTGYEKAEHFFNGLATVQSKGKWGCIDKNNVVVIDFLYDGIFNFDTESAICIKNHKYGFLNLKGKEIIPPIYDRADSFSEGLAGVQMNGKWGFIDENGKIVITYLYEQIYGFNKGLAFVKAGGKWGAIDRAGNVVIPFNYDFLGCRDGDVLQATIENKSGYLNSMGKVVVPIKYDRGRCPFLGVLEVSNNGKIKYFDYGGKRLQR